MPFPADNVAVQLPKNHVIVVPIGWEVWLSIARLRLEVDVVKIIHRAPLGALSAHPRYSFLVRIRRHFSIFSKQFHFRKGCLIEIFNAPF